MSLAQDLLRRLEPETEVVREISKPLRINSRHPGTPRGIYQRANGHWHARLLPTSIADCHIGIFCTAMEACKALAERLGLKVEELPGITPDFIAEASKKRPGPVLRYRKDANSVIPHKALREWLTYRNGELFFLKATARRPVGTVAGNGPPEHRKVRLPDGKYYQVNRLIWYWHSGEWPCGQIRQDDPRKGDRIENLILHTAGGEVHGRDLVNKK